MTILMERRLLPVGVFHIDTNLINARQMLDVLNQLEKWFDDGVILINMSGTAHVEAQAGGNAVRARKANRQIFTVTPAAEPSSAEYRRVENALFPQGARTENERNDVRIVCDAAHYAATLVTADGGSKSQPGGILGNRHKVANLVRIFSPDEAVAFVRGKIRERDEFNARVAREFGGELPEWTGQD
jgi:hypothetical protein